MFGKILLASMIVVFSTGAVLAGAKAPHPDGRDMHGMMDGAHPENCGKQEQGMACCDLKTGNRLGAKHKPHQSTIGDSKGATLMMDDGPCVSAPVDPSAKILRGSSYSNYMKH